MKTILRRKDNSSIFCPPVAKKYHSSSLKTKTIELFIACLFIGTGLIIIINF
ncbi:MAG TPA: hypothetical protein HA258_03570 [Thermoplasmata archaeon]|jgi:hypothetical protein|nr:hypothetical protein [Thermoplasmata archaeon]HIH29537.1 hypothetical protein [Thermoplasmata archaeon]